MTGTDLEPVRDVLQPFTGELIPVSDVAALAEALDQLRDLGYRLNDAKAAFTEAVAEHARREGTRTLTAGGWRVELSADTEIEWDLDVLAKLRDLGLPEHRYDELVRATVTYKVDGRVVRQLETVPEYAEVIERARIRVPKRQYATVKAQP